VTLIVVAALLAAPLVALLWVGSYNSESPHLWGFPFFYWYQLMWVIVAAVATSAAYLLVTRTGTDVEVTDPTDTGSDNSESNDSEAGR
jgi:membrane protein implicated in regulation of membrane protease activity